MASSLEGNKIFAAILTAGILAVGSSVFSRIFYAPHFPEEPHYKVALESAEEGGAAEAPEVAPLPVRLAAADADTGEKFTRVCAACHTFDQGGANKVGPNLWGIIGEPIGKGANGFAFSSALSSKEGEWTYDDLDHFLADPRGWAPGTKMTYAGIKDPEDRADVIAYLRTLSDDPPPLPTPEARAEPTSEAAQAEAGAAAAAPSEPETGASQATGTEAATDDADAAQEPEAAAGADQQADDAAAGATPDQPADSAAAAAPAGGGDGGGQQFAVLVAAADPAKGEAATRVCAACHSFDKGGPNRVGPNLYGVVGEEIASESREFKFSDALSSKEGTWTYESLNEFLSDPRGWAPGTKMIFAGIKDEQKRADVIAYLRSLSDDPEPLPEAGKQG